MSRPNPLPLPNRPAEHAVPQPLPAGFVSRSIAFAIDLGLITIVIVGASSLVQLIGLLLPKWIWLTAALPVVITAVVSFIPLTYFFLTVGIAGQTLGKALMGIRIVDAGGGRLSLARSLIRTFAYLVSLIPLLMGFLWILIDRDRRAWHDLISGSRVVYEPRSPQL